MSVGFSVEFPSDFDTLNPRMNRFLTICLLSLAVEASAQEPINLEDQKDRFGYAIGANIGYSLQRGGVSASDELMSLEAMMEGLRDVFEGGETQLDNEQIRSTLQEFQQIITQKRQQEKVAAAAANLKASEEFLMANKATEGVQVLESGLQYIAERPGTGSAPGPQDTVSVHYKGTLIDGTEFDSSYRNNRPAEFRVNQVIPGWTEALQLMRPGAKWKLFVPPGLAYGERGSGANIGPNQALVFEVELLSVKQANPPKPQIVTSDIIKVPSREELEQGAEIEIIPADKVQEEIEKQEQQEPTTEPEPDEGQ